MEKHFKRICQKQFSILLKIVLKICSKFTGVHPCRSAISIKLQINFIEITLWHGCSIMNLLQIFRTSFPKNTSHIIKPFYANFLFLYSLKTSNNQRFCEVFRGYKNGILAWNGLMTVSSIFNLNFVIFRVKC